MTRICRATTGPADWRALLADPDRQWRAGYSAMAAAQSWEAGFPPEVARLCGPQAELQLAIVEHKVAMPAQGYPSQCDIFALVHADGRDMAVAVEAKVAEPFGPTVGDWLGPTPSANKIARLAGICDRLGLPGADPALRYQLLHRTAAAVAEARRFRRPVAAMIVQSFSRQDEWSAEFTAFAAVFGLAIGPGTAAEAVLPDGLVLRLGWARGDAAFLRDLSLAAPLSARPDLRKNEDEAP